MDAGMESQTIMVVFKKRLADGSVRQSVPLNDSSAGYARVVHMPRYVQLLHEGRKSGDLLSPAFMDIEPHFAMTSYVAVAHSERDLDGERLPPGTTAVGEGSWLDVKCDAIHVDVDISRHAGGELLDFPKAMTGCRYVEAC